MPSTTAMFGEVGLAGEIRGVTQAALRVREAAQLGFSRCLMPDANLDAAGRALAGLELECAGVRTVADLMNQLFD